MFCQHAVFDGGPDAPRTIVHRSPQEPRGRLLEQAHAEDRCQSWWSVGCLAFVALVRWILVRPDPVPVAQPASSYILVGGHRRG